jgi:hypothetical protein
LRLAVSRFGGTVLALLFWQTAASSPTTVSSPVVPQATAAATSIAAR